MLLLLLLLSLAGLLLFGAALLAAALLLLASAQLLPWAFKQSRSRSNSSSSTHSPAFGKRTTFLRSPMLACLLLLRGICGACSCLLKKLVIFLSFPITALLLCLLVREASVCCGMSVIGTTPLLTATVLCWQPPADAVLAGSNREAHDQKHHSYIGEQAMVLQALSPADGHLVSAMFKSLCSYGTDVTGRAGFHATHALICEGNKMIGKCVLSAGTSASAANLVEAVSFVGASTIRSSVLDCSLRHVWCLDIYIFFNV
jgi:hypothetical protein